MRRKSYRAKLLGTSSGKTLPRYLRRSAARISMRGRREQWSTEFLIGIVYGSKFFHRSSGSVFAEAEGTGESTFPKKAMLVCSEGNRYRTFRPLEILNREVVTELAWSGQQKFCSGCNNAPEWSALGGQRSLNQRRRRAPSGHPTVLFRNERSAPNQPTMSWLPPVCRRGNHPTSGTRRATHPACNRAKSAAIARCRSKLNEASVQCHAGHRDSRRAAAPCAAGKQRPSPLPLR